MRHYTAIYGAPFLLAGHGAVNSPIAGRGSLYHGEQTITLVRAQGGPITQFIGIMNDVTEKKQLAAMALRAQRLESIGTLVGGVAHDLNTALSPILMRIQRLRMRYSDDTAMIDTMESSATRGAAMVRQLLTFAKGTKGERILVQPQHLLKEMDKIVKGTFPKNIAVRLNVTNDCRTVLGDSTQLHVVSRNHWLRRSPKPGG